MDTAPCLNCNFKRNNGVRIGLVREVEGKGTQLFYAHIPNLDQLLSSEATYSAPASVKMRTFHGSAARRYSNAVNGL